MSLIEKSFILHLLKGSSSTNHNTEITNEIKTIESSKGLNESNKEVLRIKSSRKELFLQVDIKIMNDIKTVDDFKGLK